MLFLVPRPRWLKETAGSREENIFSPTFVSLALYYARQRVLTIWPFRGTPLFPFGTEWRKGGNFPVSSVSSAENNYSTLIPTGMAEWRKLSSFQSLISRKQLREIEVQMVSAISFGWFADFGKTLTIIQRSSQPVYSDKW